MSDNRSSVRHAKIKQTLRGHKEKVARDIAYEAGATLEATDTSVFILDGDSRQLLCSVLLDRDLWPQALEAICKMYPHLARHS